MKLKAIAAAALAAPLVVACGSTESAKAPYKLNGAGATFPAPYYNAVLGDLAKSTGNKVNYQAVGSGAGVRQFTAKTETSVPLMVLCQMLRRNCPWCISP